MDDWAEWIEARPGRIAALVLAYASQTENHDFNILSRMASPAGRWLAAADPGQPLPGSSIFTSPGLLCRNGYQPAADYDAADCARVREYVEIVRGMLGDEELPAFGMFASFMWGPIEGIYRRAMYPLQSEPILSLDTVDRPLTILHAVCATIAAVPAVASEYLYEEGLAGHNPKAAFAAVAIVLADAALADWDPYRIGRESADCDCALCAGEWPEDAAIGPCGCERGRGCAARSRAIRCVPIDWGKIAARGPAAEALAHAAEALGRRAVWDARSPAIAAVAADDTWWTALGLRPPQPTRFSQLAFTD